MSRLSSNKSAASRNASADSSVTSVFTPKVLSTANTEVNSNPLKAPPTSLLSPSNDNYSVDSLDGKVSPCVQSPPLAHAKIEMIPEVDLADGEKTQFIWVAVEIRAERFVAK